MTLFHLLHLFHIISTTMYKSMYKSDLAAAAGVSSEVFKKWLRNDREQLKEMGVLPRSKLLNPAAVKYLCDKYVIFP